MAHEALDAVDELVRRALAERGDRLLVIGLCGAQGSGKSTLADGLRTRLAQDGVPAAILSIDDLYRTRAEREALARAVHPLLRTRGVPGTHDVALGLQVIEALERGEAALLPRFDKASDDRLPEARWERAAAGTRLLLLEGWCVGARPQEASELAAPVNALEREEDADGVWRAFVNRALAGDYQTLFGRLDRLVMLAAPGFEVVRRWRTQQEHGLRKAAAGGMSDAEVARFIQHYERLTRHMLVEMPGRADLAIALDAARRVTGIGGTRV
ncbi:MULTISPECIES: kinase [unclassified Sphingobium]|uniref:kinase n=1 Tax=unclassified Sphingobium TaxID=2611147 RepID=UPI0007701D4A|nr:MULTISPECIES: kinase [Sphingomonadaceae]AMK24423.1 putative kinase [Sphingobium sp. TKS]NML88708.1 kinase [Sphingobium sp. TB-6]